MSATNNVFVQGGVEAQVNRLAKLTNSMSSVCVLSAIFLNSTRSITVFIKSKEALVQIWKNPRNREQQTQARTQSMLLNWMKLIFLY